jgi:hypothetical protein
VCVRQIWLVKHKQCCTHLLIDRTCVYLLTRSPSRRVRPCAVHAAPQQNKTKPAPLHLSVRAPTPAQHNYCHPCLALPHKRVPESPIKLHETKTKTVTAQRTRRGGSTPKIPLSATSSSSGKILPGIPPSHREKERADRSIRFAKGPG